RGPGVAGARSEGAGGARPGVPADHSAHGGQLRHCARCCRHAGESCRGFGSRRRRADRGGGNKRWRRPRRPPQETRETESQMSGLTGPHLAVLAVVLGAYLATALAAVLFYRRTLAFVYPL